MSLNKKQTKLKKKHSIIGGVLVVLLLFLAIRLIPPWYTASQSEYKVNPETNEVTLTAYVGRWRSTIRVPSQIWWKPVRGIEGLRGRASFAERIYLPDGLEELGLYLFSSHPYLEYVQIADGITVLPAGMFRQCKSLPEVDIPESVTSLIRWAFMYCESLTIVEFPPTLVYFV